MVLNQDYNVICLGQVLLDYSVAVRQRHAGDAEDPGILPHTLRLVLFQHVNRQCLATSNVICYEIDGFLFLNDHYLWMNSLYSNDRYAKCAARRIWKAVKRPSSLTPLFDKSS